MRNKHYFSDIIRRLEIAIHCDVGEKGFKILLYGWRMKMGIPVYNFYGRDYMNDSEIASFSRYAGYDLSRDF